MWEVTWQRDWGKGRTTLEKLLSKDISEMWCQLYVKTRKKKFLQAGDLQIWSSAENVLSVFAWKGSQCSTNIVADDELGGNKGANHWKPSRLGRIWDCIIITFWLSFPLHLGIHELLENIHFVSKLVVETLVTVIIQTSYCDKDLLYKDSLALNDVLSCWTFIYILTTLSLRWLWLESIFLYFCVPWLNSNEPLLRGCMHFTLQSFLGPVQLINPS